MTASEDERADVTGAESPTRQDVPGSGPDFRPPVGAASGNGSGTPDEPVTERMSAGGTPDQPSGGTDGAKAAKPRKKSSFWKELPILIGIALVLTFLIQTFVARVYVIPSGSMEQTLHGCPGCTGDRILVDKITYDFTSPSPGDVIVFQGPPGWAQSEFNVTESHNIVIKWLRQFGSSIGIGSPPEYDLVKRVIAVGGQTISCCDKQNRVLVDGKPLNEPYVFWAPGTQPTQESFAPVTIPKGDLWVMGDNRNDSYDSRFQNGGGINGVVPESDVIGIARTRIWPPNRWGGVGETNPQTLASSMGAPTIPGVPAPLGIGALAAWPTLWLGRKTFRRPRGGRR